MLGLDEGAQLVVDGFQDAAHGRSVARRLVAAAAGFLLAAACSTSGGGGLDEVAAGLEVLERASIDLRLDVGGTGFTIDGAFSVSDDRPLPVARLTYTPSDGGPTTTVLLTGHDGFVEVDGVAYRLPPDQLDALRVPEGGGASAVSSIRLERWLEVETTEDGVYEGDGDAVVVLEDIVALASGLGAADVPAVPFDRIGDLRVRVVAPDGELHELTASGDDLTFALELDDHGEPVEVDPPEEARPFDELGR